MGKLKTLLISLCFKIIDRLMDEKNIIEPAPRLDALVDDLTDGVVVGTLCQCPKGSACEFFKLDEDEDEICLYGKI